MELVLAALGSRTDNLHLCGFSFFLPHDFPVSATLTFKTFVFLG
jgi:hypothetical protein